MEIRYEYCNVHVHFLVTQAVLGRGVVLYRALGSFFTCTVKVPVLCPVTYKICPVSDMQVQVVISC